MKVQAFLAIAILGVLHAPGYAQDISLEYGMSDAEAVEINGTNITYIERGSGAPMVLVHGAFSDLRYWQTVMDTLARSHRVIAYSRRDFYPNSLDQPPTENAFADRDDLATFIEMLGIAPVHLVGHSRGGHVTLALAAARPDLLRSATTIEGGFLDEGVSEEALAALDSFGPVIQTVLEHFEADEYELGTRTFLEYALGHESYQGWSESAKRIALDNARAFGRRPQAGLSCADVDSISVPVLLMIGSETPSENKAMMQGVEDCVPNLEVAEVRGASHSIHFDNPDDFTRVLLDFVSRH